MSTQKRKITYRKAKWKSRYVEKVRRLTEYELLMGIELGWDLRDDAEKAHCDKFVVADISLGINILTAVLRKKRTPRV